MITQNRFHSYLFSLFALLFFITMSSNTLQAQTLYFQDDEPPENFYDFVNAYYDQAPPSDEEGGDRKEVERASMMWGERLYPHGDFTIASNAMYDYVINYDDNCGEQYNPNWTELGPLTVPMQNPDGESSAANSRGIGQIHRITFDPQYNIGTNQTIYAASSFGGGMAFTEWWT